MHDSGAVMARRTLLLRDVESRSVPASLPRTSTEIFALKRKRAGHQLRSHGDHLRIAEEARLDGFYVIRTSVEDRALAAESVVGAYRSLARVERAFRSLKTVDLHLRPIHHWLASRVRAHVFLCMLACHVEWHMRECLKPMLFDDEDPAAGAAERASIVAPAQPSPSALRKRGSKATADGDPVHS